MIDLYTSRRKAFLECEYWKQIDNDYIVPNSQIEYEQIPNGFFMAEIVSNVSVGNNEIYNVFMTQVKNLTITTCDDVSDLSVNDIVKINGENTIFRVENINLVPMKKQTQFIGKENSFQYTITLRG